MKLPHSLAGKLSREKARSKSPDKDKMNDSKNIAKMNDSKNMTKLDDSKKQAKKVDPITEVERFIKEGRTVIFPVKGTSMLPFIIGSRDKVEFHPVEGDLHPGDIIMARVEGGYPVVHRIVNITADRITLSGDGNLGFKEYCAPSQVIAQGLYVITPKGHRKSLNSPAAIKKWKIWMALLPIRRILLKLFKISHGIK